MTSRTKRYFVHLFVCPQVERWDDWCWLWISTNSIVSIRTASSESTKKFGRCRVYSYFQYILLCVAGYSTLRMTRFPWLCHRICMKAPCEWYDSCDRIPRIRYNVDQNILIHMTINSYTMIVDNVYALQGNSSNQRELSAHSPPSNYTTWWPLANPLLASLPQS